MTTVTPVPPKKPARPNLISGRMNRKWFAIISAGVIVLSIGLSYIPALTQALGAGFTVVWVMLFGRRLHDMGRSAWWVALLFGIEAIAAIGGGLLSGMDGALGAAGLTQIVLTIVLAVWPGTKGPNQFGPPQGAPTADDQAQVFS